MGQWYPLIITYTPLNVSVAIEAIVGGANANIIGFIGLLKGPGQHQWGEKTSKSIKRCPAGGEMQPYHRCFSYLQIRLLRSFEFRLSSLGRRGIPPSLGQIRLAKIGLPLVVVCNVR